MADIAETLYLQSPVWLQQAMVGVYGWWWYRRRFSGHFHRLVAEYRGREDWSASQFQQYQEEQLAGLLAAAWSAPYYRQAFLESGVTPGMAPFDALGRLPLLPKEVLRQRPEDLLTGRPPRGTIIQRTSGTTGTPVRVWYTPEFHALEMAVPEARNLNWAGVNYRDRRVMFGVRKVCRFDQDRPPFWRYSPVENMAYASVFHLSPRFLPSYLDFLRRYQPSIVMGYPSELNLIARYALDNDDLPAPAKAVITTSEPVTDHARGAIEAAWQCRLHDRYGAVEGCVFASQCEFGRYHVSPEVGIIEIIDRNGRPCPPGVLGEVVCTGLGNRLQPLIRYRLGDAARWAVDQTCPCGRQLPILEAIEGRYEQICYTPDGRQMLRFDAVFEGVEGIRETQIVQEAIDLFTVYLVPTEDFDEHGSRTIERNMRAHAGDVTVRVRTVPLIERSPSGKFQAVRCNIPVEERPLIQRSPAPGSGCAERQPE